MDQIDKGNSRLDLETLLEGYPLFQQILHNMQQVVWLLDLNTDQILYVSPCL